MPQPAQEAAVRLKMCSVPVEGPLQAHTLRPVPEGKGVAARRGLEQLGVHHRSVG